MSDTETTVKKRKGKSQEKSKPTKQDDGIKQSKTDTDEVPVIHRYGPLPRIPNQRIWTRGVMIFGILAVVYFTTKDRNEVPFARQKDLLELRAQDVDCSDDYKSELQQFPGCVPQRCGRLISDKLVTVSESDQLLSLAQRGLSLGTQGGAASILDLHSGALSMDNSFVNIYKLEAAKNLFKPTDFLLYRMVKAKIQHAVAQHFGLDVTSIFLTHPTFFSRLTNLPPATLHDQYWHPHVDKETYKSFHYTSLLYLNDFGRDFQGGRFVFVDSDQRNKTVEPRKGRVSMFTSGSENVHYVERVTSGTRYAITVSFTCDKNHAISDPSVETNHSA